MLEKVYPPHPQERCHRGNWRGLVLGLANAQCLRTMEASCWGIHVWLVIKPFLTRWHRWPMCPWRERNTLCVHVHMCMCIHVHVYEYVCFCVFLCVCVCVCACMCVLVKSDRYKNYPILSDLNNSSYKSEIRVLAWSGSGEGIVPALQMADFSLLFFYMGGSEWYTNRDRLWEEKMEEAVERQIFFNIYVCVCICVCIWCICVFVYMV